MICPSIKFSRGAPVPAKASVMNTTVSSVVLTAFDAIMEAGGFDNARANAKEVRVIRQEDGQTKTYTINLKAILDGAAGEPFYLKAHDVIFVPEKISWF